MPDEKACAEFLDAVRASDRPAQQAAFERIAVPLRQYVERLAEGRGCAQLGLAASDVAQDVLRQLWGRPPCGSDGRSARATLLEWCKTTTFRRLASYARSAESRPRRLFPAREGEHEGTRAEEEAAARAARVSVSEEARLETRSEIALLRAMLEDCYPHGLVFLDDPAGTDAELAADLGISIDNLYQRRSRMQKYVRALRRLEEDLDAPDEEVARAMGVQLDQTHRRMIARVQLWLRSRRNAP